MSGIYLYHGPRQAYHSLVLATFKHSVAPTFTISQLPQNRLLSIKSSFRYVASDQKESWVLAEAEGVRLGMLREFKDEPGNSHPQTTTMPSFPCLFGYIAAQRDVVPDLPLALPVLAL